MKIKQVITALAAGSIAVGGIAATTSATTGTTAGTAAGTTAGTTAGTMTASVGTTAGTMMAPTDAEKAEATTRLDTNKDGKVVFGIAAAGPRDDGGYYQATIDAATELSTAYGFADPIVVDKITTENAATELSNLVDQNVDVMIIGAGEIAAPLPDLIKAHPDVFWYCNCGAGYADNPGLAQSLDDSSEISYTAGYATGLLLKARNATKSVFIGCCDVNFEKEAYMAFEMGLKAVDSSMEMKYVATGKFPYDFDNTAGATEALNAAATDGAQAVYPFLGGAHEPVVKAADAKDMITMSAGSSKACSRTDLKYDIAVRFDGGDYLRAVLSEIIAGKFVEGQKRVFHVGVDPQPGAVICKPTADQEAAMKQVYADVAAGKFTTQFNEIKAKAYAGG